MYARGKPPRAVKTPVLLNLAKPPRSKTQPSFPYTCSAHPIRRSDTGRTGFARPKTNVKLHTNRQRKEKKAPMAFSQNKSRVSSHSIVRCVVVGQESDRRLEEKKMRSAVTLQVISDDKTASFELENGKGVSLKDVLDCALGSLKQNGTAEIGKIFLMLPDDSKNQNDGLESWDLPCSSCQRQIRGFCYRCVACHGYNLCAQCEFEGVHDQHDMLRMSSLSRTYPPHFFARLHRLYDRTISSSSDLPLMVQQKVTSQGLLEPLVGEEELCKCCLGDVADEDEVRMQNDAIVDDEEMLEGFPSVAEVTRDIMELTKKDKSPALNNHEIPVQYHDRESNSICESPAAKSNHEVPIRYHDLNSNDMKDIIDDELTKILKKTTQHLESLDALASAHGKEAKSEAEMMKVDDVAASAENVNEEGCKVESKADHEVTEEVETMDTIQGLQQEIDKLLAPLTSLTPNQDENDDEKLNSLASSRSSLVQSPFELCGGRDSTEIVTAAIIETNNNGNFNNMMGQKKRVLRHNSSSDEDHETGNRGVTPKKVFKKGEQESIDFDTITVDEVLEIRNEDANQASFKEEEEDDDEYEYYDEEEEEDEETGKVDPQASPDVKIDKPEESKREPTPPRKDDPLALLSPRERWGLKKKPEDLEDPLTRMEIRRALHRAGLDPSLITSSASKKAVADAKEAKDHEEEKSSKEYRDSWRSRYLETSSASTPLKSAPATPSTKIKESLDQMLSMGFTDDDGWLTQLLTMKKGDIAEVLEILAPVERANAVTAKSRTTSVPSASFTPSRIYGRNKYSSFS